MKPHFQLESDGFNLKAIENLWSSTSAVAGGNGSLSFQPSEANPYMDCHAEPFLQIGYSKFPFLHMLLYLKLIRACLVEILLNTNVKIAFPKTLFCICEYGRLTGNKFM